MMYTTILLAAALQNWDRYSTHALAAREVAATLAKGASHHLHVLTVYDPPPIDTGNLPAESPPDIGRICCVGRMPSWSKKWTNTWRRSKPRG